MTSSKMKISKGFIAQLIVAILLSLIFLGLGNWQLDRSDAVRALNKVVVDKAEIDLEEIAVAGANLEPEAINRLVSATGRYSQKFLAPNQKVSINGSEERLEVEVGLLELTGARAILVIRGAASEIETLESGEVKVSGRLYPRQSADSAIGIGNKLSRIDPALVVSKTELALFDGYIIATSEVQATGGVILRDRIDAPQLISEVAGHYWQHISYVFIWWLMAILVLFAPFYNSIKDRQSGGKVGA
jgi:surfeit locus 1 family protein